MAPCSDLLAGSVEDAAQHLARLAVSGRVKRAAEGAEGAGWWSQLPDVVKAAIIGGGLGTGVGAASNLLRPKKDRRWLSDSLRGLLAGGALGAAVPLIQYGRENFPGADAHSKPPPAASPRDIATAGAETSPLTSLVNWMTGKTPAVDPRSLESAPGAAVAFARNFPGTTAVSTAAGAALGHLADRRAGQARGNRQLQAELSQSLPAWSENVRHGIQNARLDNGKKLEAIITPLHGDVRTVVQRDAVMDLLRRAPLRSIDMAKPPTSTGALFDVPAYLRTASPYIRRQFGGHPLRPVAPPLHPAEMQQLLALGGPNPMHAPEVQQRILAAKTPGRAGKILGGLGGAVASPFAAAAQMFLPDFLAPEWTKQP